MKFVIRKEDVLKGAHPYRVTEDGGFVSSAPTFAMACMQLLHYMEGKMYTCVTVTKMDRYKEVMEMEVC